MRHPLHPASRNRMMVPALWAAMSLALGACRVEAGIPASAVTDIWVVFKTHFDLGFTDLPENVFAKYRGFMMDHAVTNIETNRHVPPEQRFIWTMPAWPLTHVLGPSQTAERRNRIEQAVRDGTLAFHALPFTLHTESLDLEDLVRGLGLASALSRSYGCPLPRSAKMTDVPCHGWILPTLLANAGVRFLHIGVNDASACVRVPPLFFWEGPDGSRVMCNYSPNYGSDLKPPANWPSRNYLAMIMTTDNEGPPTSAAVNALRRRIGQDCPGVRVHFGTLDDFRRALEAEKPVLPVVRGDMPDTWIHGLMSMPQETRLARNIRPLEGALDSLTTHLGLFGLNEPSVAPLLAKAYEQSLLFGEHTWGMNALFGGGEIGDLSTWRATVPSQKQKRFLKSFDDHRAYSRNADTIVSGAISERMRRLAAAVKGSGDRLVVFNPLPWTRSGLVPVPDRPGESLLAEEVPANGYRTLVIKTSRAASTPTGAVSNVVETLFFKVTFDLQRGGICSLVEKASGRELIDRSSPYVLGQYLHERFSQDDIGRFMQAYCRIKGGWALRDFGKQGMPDATNAPYRASTPGGWLAQRARTDLADVVTLTAGDPRGLAKAVTLTFTFPRHEASVDVEWRVVDKTPEKYAEGGWLCFPFAVERPRFTVGRPGGAIDPATDIIAGANRHLMAVATGVAVTGDAGAGMALCPLDSPLVSLDQPGLWRWSLDFVPRKPVVFVNLHNNMWNTNFPLWQEGSWTERVRCWPLAAGADAAAELAVKGWEARVPLLAALGGPAGGSLPETQAGLTLSRKGVLVTAFGGNPDGEGTLLRVWEQAGMAGEVEVKFPAGSRFTSAIPVNLRGEKTGVAQVIRKGAFLFPLAKYAPASFVLVMEGGGPPPSRE